MRAMAFSTAVLVLLTWPALAETAPPAPAPVLDIPCDGFARNPDGSWTPTRDVNIPNPTGAGVVTVGSAVRRSSMSSIGIALPSAGTAAS